MSPVPDLSPACSAKEQRNELPEKRGNILGYPPFLHPAPLEGHRSQERIIS